MHMYIYMHMYIIISFLILKIFNIFIAANDRVDNKIIEKQYGVNIEFIKKPLMSIIKFR